jgi:hypothetical protein
MVTKEEDDLWHFLNGYTGPARKCDIQQARTSRNRAFRRKIVKINDDHYSEHKIIVPKHFIYDGASVPSFVTRLTGIRRDGEHRAAALLHDWLYHHKGRLPGGYYQINFEGECDDTWATWTREDTDRLFGRVMREFGYTRWKRVWAYRTVRWFGWLVWHDMVKLRQIILSLLTVAFFASLIIPLYVIGDLLKKIFSGSVK